MKKYYMIIFVCVFMLVFLADLSYSQSSLEGRVTDEENTALPGIEITISSPNLIGGTQSKITDVNGKYRFVQLMPGTYVVEASLTGFVTSKREGVRLFVATTLPVDFVLKIGGLDEEIIVVAESPLIDVKDSQIGTIELDKQVMQDIIFSRELYLYSVIDLAPGTTPSYHGSSAFGGVTRSGNAYRFDGVDVSASSSGNSWIIPDMYVFEESKIMGLGAPAEYDGFQGVVLSAVTKSGGNTFDGMFQFAYNDYNWMQDNIDVDDPLWALYDAPDKQGYFDPRIGLGGPIIKDKLWFYGSVNYLRNSYMRMEGPIERKWWKGGPKYMMKLTFQASPSTRMSAFILKEFFYYDYRYQTVFRPKEASSYEDCFIPVLGFRIFHAFADTTLIELNAGYSQNSDYYGGMIDDSRNVSGRHDNITGMYSVNYRNWSDHVNYRFQINTSLTHHADEFIGGSHDFKFGVEFEKIGVDDARGYNGVFWYEDNVYNWADQQHHDYAYEYGRVAEPRGTRVSAYVQDSWRVSDRITINPGFRFNLYRGHLATVGKTLFKTQGIAPRFGITWDVFGDHKTAIKAHYGRYLDKFNNNKFDAASAGIEDWIMYEVIDGSKVEIFRQNFSNPAVIDPNIKYPYVDQFTVGIERELMKDSSGSISFVYKNWGNILYRINSGAVYEKVSSTVTDNEGKQVTVDAWDQTSPSSEDAFYITNPYKGQFSSIVFDPIRKYTALLFEFQKRYSNNWMLAGSYAFSKTTATSTSRNPNNQANSYWNGDPVAYWYHNVKIYGTFSLPFVSISPTLEYRGGNRWTSYARMPVTGSPSRNIEKTGINKMPDVINLDLRIETGYTIKADLRLAVFLDIYNVLNRGVAIGMYSRVGSANYGLATDANMGRAFRAAVRFYF